jgi:hypothetical protein
MVETTKDRRPTLFHNISRYHYATLSVLTGLNLSDLIDAEMLVLNVSRSDRGVLQAMPW